MSLPTSVRSCFRPCVLSTFTISVRCVCPMSLFNESVWILLVYKWSSSCVSYWSLPFAALFWIIVVFSLAAALWFIFIFGWVSNNCMYVLMWSWCDGGSSSQNAIIPQCPTPNVSIIPQCHPSRKVLHFIWWWRHVEIPSISSEYFCMTRTWRHVIFVFHFRFLMISFSDKAKNPADSRNLILATFFDF